MGKEDSVIPYVVALTVFAVIEGLIGFTRGNVHVIRDFLNAGLMVGCMVLSYNAARMSRQKRSNEFTYGYRRLNILAAFTNTVYI
jgi:Co/Zn/Cd efflux system component